MHVQRRVHGVCAWRVRGACMVCTCMACTCMHALRMAFRLHTPTQLSLPWADRVAVLDARRQLQRAKEYSVRSLPLPLPPSPPSLLPPPHPTAQRAPSNHLMLPTPSRQAELALAESVRRSSAQAAAAPASARAAAAPARAMRTEERRTARAARRASRARERATACAAAAAAERAAQEHWHALVHRVMMRAAGRQTCGLGWRGDGRRSSRTGSGVRARRMEAVQRSVRTLFGAGGGGAGGGGAGGGARTIEPGPRRWRPAGGRRGRSHRRAPPRGVPSVRAAAAAARLCIEARQRRALRRVDRRARARAAAIAAVAEARGQGATAETAAEAARGAAVMAQVASVVRATGAPRGNATGEPVRR